MRIYEREMIYLWSRDAVVCQKYKNLHHYHCSTTSTIRAMNGQPEPATSTRLANFDYQLPCLSCLALSPWDLCHHNFTCRLLVL
jgi:hypothetical protein